MKINFNYNRKHIDTIEGYILKGKLYRCNYIRFKTLYNRPLPGTETVQLYNFMPKGNMRASAIILHGLGSDNIKFLLWMGTHLASAGVNSTVVILPGNYTRVDDKSVSGKNFLWPDIKLMYRLWEHAVVDVLSTIDLLQQNNLWEENNCIVGYCLGGMLSTIISAIDKRVNQTILITTGGHLPKMFHESPATRFVRKMFKEGFKSEYYLHDKKQLYKIYKEQFKIVKQMPLIGVLKSEDIHPLFRIDPISYAHLLNKKNVTYIDALFDFVLPLTSRAMLFNEMKGAVRYIIPMTHLSWLPFERFLAQYILFKVNINDKKSAKLVLKKQKIENILFRDKF